MVRMCEMMTLCCATVLVAGTVATAADKAPRAAQPATAGAVRQVNSAREAIPGWNANGAALGLGAACDCVGWDNGRFDWRNGQASHLGGGNTCGTKAADDFYLCEGQIYELRSIGGTLITNSLAGLRRAKLEIYSDCNGCPAALLYTLSIHEAPVVGASLGDGYYAVDYKFVIANQTDVVGNNHISLKGGTYWLSLYGLSDGQGVDQSFWATTGGTATPPDVGPTVIKGSVAKKRSGQCTGWPNQFSFPACSVCCWDSLDECCIGCTDLAFVICADNCKILIDNGGVALPLAGQRSERSVGNSRNSRAADDFVVPPCTDLSICYIEGCVYTNCVDFSGFFEIYDNDCKLPSYVLGGSVSSDRKGIANKIVDLGYTINLTYNGHTFTHRAWRLEFHDLTGICLTAGRQYWISLGVDDTFAFNERAFFCYNDDCRRRPCLVRFNPGAYIATGDLAWTSTGSYDFSFLIAAHPCTAATGNAGSTTCAADFNHDGQPTVQDIFDFLATWFTGCP